MPVPRVPDPLDELPIHQVPTSLRFVGTSDRNAYDRCILHAFSPDGATYLVAGVGLYPNLGVIDGYVTVRQGERQWAVQASDAIGGDRSSQAVGPIRVEVLEPLRKLRVVCDGAAHGLACDLIYEAAFPGREEPRHLTRTEDRVANDACRFVQLGRWSGTLEIEGRPVPVEGWSGDRDRSWGIRRVGEPEPAGRPPTDPVFGFWWVWAPLRFKDYAVVVIAGEDPDGTRTIHEAVRIFSEDSGRAPEQLGWAEFDIAYRSGTRHPERATIHLSGRRGKPFDIELETINSMALNVGCGYSSTDPDWSHGVWKGPNWVRGVTYDLTDPDLIARSALTLSDHVARATCDDGEGIGIFEHAILGRHEPTGFADWSAVAP